LDEPFCRNTKIGKTAHDRVGSGMEQIGRPEDGPRSHVCRDQELGGNPGR
jgi:hypothetical protein